jgi:predicted dehydrogenase
MKDKVRIAMIGAGSMANRVHYPSLASFPDVEIAAICDLSEARLNATADKYNVAARFSDYQKMIETIAPDGVYAIGPPHHMLDIWIWCLQQKLNLYIEKPLGLSLHHAQILTDLAESVGVITQVSHQRRACPIFVKMREECLKNGPIVHASCEFFKNAPVSNVSAYDHMQGDGVHAIDTVRWMCGGEVTKVQSHCKRVGAPDINWIHAILHFDSGATGLVSGSWSSGRRIFRVQMHSQGVACDAEDEGKARLYRDGDVQGIEYDTREVAGSDEIFVFGGFQAKNREFIDALKAGQHLTKSPFSDCLKTMKVAHIILAQALLNE